MGLDAKNELKQAILVIDKINKTIGEIRTIEKRKKTIQERMVNSALGGETTGTESKEIIGLEKVIESMTEEIDRKTSELGEKMKDLRTVYRRKAEANSIGQISEAVPE